MTEIEPEILSRARAGDREAHAVLYRAFAPMVYTLARRMLGSAALAEDVVQDCFVEVIRKADRFRGAAGVGHWIRQIAVNKALDHFRSPWRRRRADDAVATAALDSLAAHEARVVHDPVLLRALDSLSGTARAVLWLHAVEGYTHEEIGRLMGHGPSFSKSQFARARERLRQVLEPDEPEQEASSCLRALKSV